MANQNYREQLFTKGNQQKYEKPSATVWKAIGQEDRNSGVLGNLLKIGDSLTGGGKDGTGSKVLQLWKMLNKKKPTEVDPTKVPTDFGEAAKMPDNEIESVITGQESSKYEDLMATKYLGIPFKEGKADWETLGKSLLGIPPKGSVFNRFVGSPNYDE